MAQYQVPLAAPVHQRTALPLHQLIVLVFGFLAFACIVGGIVGIYFNAKSDTGLEIFGVHLSTGHVGVAFVGLGLIIGLFMVRAVLRSQRELAALPLHCAQRDAINQSGPKRILFNGKEAYECTIVLPRVEYSDPGTKAVEGTQDLQ
jgi:hypothetical protein